MNENGIFNGRTWVIHIQGHKVFIQGIRHFMPGNGSVFNAKKWAIHKQGHEFFIQGPDFFYKEVSYSQGNKLFVQGNELFIQGNE